jgi:hypothetical protein
MWRGVDCWMSVRMIKMLLYCLISCVGGAVYV